MSFTIIEYFSELLSKEVGADLRDSQLRDPHKEEETIFIGGHVKVFKQKSDSSSTQFQGRCSKAYTERDRKIPSKPITAR